MREGWPRAACARPLTGHRFTDSPPPVGRAPQQFAGSLHVRTSRSEYPSERIAAAVKRAQMRAGSRRSATTRATAPSSSCVSCQGFRIGNDGRYACAARTLRRHPPRPLAASARAHPDTHLLGMRYLETRRTASSRAGSHVDVEKVRDGQATPGRQRGLATLRRVMVKWEMLQRRNANTEAGAPQRAPALVCSIRR